MKLYVLIQNVLKNKKAKTEKSKEKTKLKPSTPSKNVVVVKPGADETVVERGKRLVGYVNHFHLQMYYSLHVLYA